MKLNRTYYESMKKVLLEADKNQRNTKSNISNSRSSKRCASAKSQRKTRFTDLKDQMSPFANSVNRINKPLTQGYSKNLKDKTEEDLNILLDSLRTGSISNQEDDKIILPNHDRDKIETFFRPRKDSIKDAIKQIFEHSLTSNCMIQTDSVGVPQPMSLMNLIKSTPKRRVKVERDLSGSLCVQKYVKLENKNKKVLQKQENFNFFGNFEKTVTPTRIRIKILKKNKQDDICKTLNLTDSLDLPHPKITSGPVSSNWRNTKIFGKGYSRVLVSKSQTPDNCK